MLIKTVFLVVALLFQAEAGKILGIFPFPGISHHILAVKLMKGLAEAGHDVTVVTPFATKDFPKNGSYKEVLLDGHAEKFRNSMQGFNLFDSDATGPAGRIMSLFNVFLHTTNQTMHHPKMKELADSKQKFDVIIMEQFLNDAHKVYSHILNCPLILLSSVGPNYLVNNVVGNPEPISYIPHMMSRGLGEDLSFLFRLKNLFFYLLSYTLSNFMFFPKQDQILHETYPNAPPLHQLYTNVSLILLNSHTSIYKAVPIVPNMVEIGGYFIDPPKKLPQDLQDFMDNAAHGVVYFSMGSNLRSKDLPHEKKQIILKVLGKLKQKVIWKFEEDLPGKPSNVMIKQWCPQTDILAHPNIKLFITHGGLLSTTEAIYHGVPVLAIPVFGDQPHNADRLEAMGIGLKLGYHDPDFTEQRFGYLVNELLTNPKYKHATQEKSKLFHDRPMKPMETAVYWVEYVIRHKGAPHLRVAGVDLAWYKYLMVDVIGVIVLAFVLVVYFLKLATKKICCTSIDAQGSKKLKTK